MQPADSTTMIIRPPRWFRAMFVAAFVGCCLVAAASLVLIDNRLGVAFGLITSLGALLLGPIALMSLTRRLEHRDGRLILVRITGRDESLVKDIESIQLSPFGNGLSRSAFIRSDGSRALGARHAWSTTDLMDLAKRINVPVLQM